MDDIQVKMLIGGQIEAGIKRRLWTYHIASLNLGVCIYTIHDVMHSRLAAYSVETLEGLRDRII